MNRRPYIATKDTRRAMLVTVFQKQRGKCCWCSCQMKLPRQGEKPDQNTATREHVIPQLLGGTHSKKNIKAACHKCNVERGARMVKELEDERRRLSVNGTER